MKVTQKDDPPPSAGLPGLSTEHDLIRYSKTAQTLILKVGNPLAGEGSQAQAKESETPSLPLLGVPQEHQAVQ